MPKMPAQPKWLKSSVSGAARSIGVDRDSKVIHGFVVAELGVFKDKRGEFTKESLDRIVELGNASQGGLKSRLSHPNLSDDGIGKRLGRAKNLFLDESNAKPMVRADLHLGRASEKTPNGDLGDYVMTLAEEDPDSFGSSLVLQVNESYRRNEDGTLQEDGEGNPLPPIWHPTELHASDVVDDGDAVTSFLSAEQVEGLPDQHVRRVTTILDQLFSGQEPDVVRSRCLAFLGRYLETEEPEDMSDDIRDLLKQQNEALNKRFDNLEEKLEKETDARLLAEKSSAELLAEQKRVKEIQELGSMHQLESELISEWIREELSVDQVRQRILEKVVEDRKLSPDNGGDDGAAGGNPGKKDPDKQFKEEYKERLRSGDGMVSITLEQYVLSRRIDEGLEPLTGPADGLAPLPIQPSAN